MAEKDCHSVTDDHDVALAIVVEIAGRDVMGDIAVATDIAGERIGKGPVAVSEEYSNVAADVVSRIAVACDCQIDVAVVMIGSPGRRSWVDGLTKVERRCGAGAGSGLTVAL